eukprot:5876168-Pyramimonas_sp.AAC.1
MTKIEGRIRSDIAMAQSAPKMVTLLLLGDFNILAAPPLLVQTPLINKGLVHMDDAVPRPLERRWNDIFSDF